MWRSRGGGATVVVSFEAGEEKLESESFLCARLPFPGPVARESRCFGGILSVPIGISEALAPLVPSPE